jgi:hypothetical protein
VRRHHTGSGRAVVVPDDWATHHAPVAEGLMTQATISLRKPGSAGTHFDPALGHTVAAPYTPFATDVPARILALTEVRVPPADAVDDQIRILGYRVSIARSHAEAALLPSAIITVITCPGDPLLVGRELEVSDVVRGTHLFERDLICTLND